MTLTPYIKKPRFFTLHELHVSLILVILISFFSAVVFTYLTKVLGDSLRQHNILSLVLIMLGYGATIWILTITFAHRFIGPFERLRYELDFVVCGNFQKRLNIRRKDDTYIRAFEEDVNSVIAVLEENCRRSTDKQRELYLSLTSVINRINTDDPLRIRLIELRDRVTPQLR